MGIAALILGITSVIIACIPFIRIIVFIPAIIGLVLGIADLFSKRKNKKKSDAIVGIVFSSIAIIILIIHFIFVCVLGLVSGSGFIQRIIDEINDDYNYPYEYDYRYDYDFDRFDEFDKFDKLERINYNNII